MPTRGRPLTVHYYAWDTLAQTPKTGDAANHALRVRLDAGTPAAPAAAAAEVDAAALPGWYAVDLSGTETDGDVVLLAGVSTTAGVIIQGEQFGMERAPTADAPVQAVLTATGLDAVLPLTGITPTIRLVDADGNRLTELNARQILAALFGVNCGDRSGVTTRAVTTGLPDAAPILTATRVSKTAIESTVVVPR